MTKIPNFENSRWRTTAILKMVLSLYLSRESPDFDEILCAGSHIGSKNGHMLTYKKFMKFKMAESRQTENRLLAISPRVIVRLTRYLVHISRTMLRQVRHVTKIAIFEYWRWRTGAILKMVSSLGYISASDHPISMKIEIWCAAADFGSKDGHVKKYQNFANSKWRMAAILKIVFWLYLNDLLSD